MDSYSGREILSPGTGTTLNKNSMSSNQKWHNSNQTLSLKPKHAITIINSEYDQEILQSQTADIPMAPQRKVT